jgi:hypothetical protein
MAGGHTPSREAMHDDLDVSEVISQRAGVTHYADGTHYTKVEDRVSLYFISLCSESTPVSAYVPRT